MPKNLTLKTFRPQMAGYDAGRKETIYHSRLFLGSQNLSHQRWLMCGRKHPFQFFCQTMTWETFTTQMSSDVFYQCLPNKTYQLKLEKCYGGELTGMTVANAMGNKLHMFVIGKAKNSWCFQKCQVFTLSLQKSTKKLDGWEIIWRVGHRAGQEVCFLRPRYGSRLGQKCQKRLLSYQPPYYQPSFP